MTKDVLISISGVHLTDGDSSDVEVITPGSYYFRNGKHYVVYDEIVDERGDMVRNTMKISPQSLDIIKSGSVSAHMIFEKDRKNVTLYQTPMGQMSVGVCTNSITIDEAADRLKVMVGYTLDVNYEPMSECSIVVDVQSRAAAKLQLS